MNEITDNVLVRSQSPIGGLVQVSTFQKAKKLVEYIVVDAGVGIPKTLRQSHPELSSDTARPKSSSPTKGPEQCQPSRGSLRRQREKDEARLKEVQGLRRQQEDAAAQTRLGRAAKLYIQAAHEGKSEEWEPERAIASAEGMPLGFEFTMAQIEMRALQIEPDLFQEWALSHQKR